MTQPSDDQCLTPDDSVAAGHGGRTRVEVSVEARAQVHAESVPTPPPTPSGQPPTDGDEIELDVSSPKLRLFKGRLYLALPDVRPPCLEEEEISDIIQRLEMDLKAAFGKIKAKSHRKPSRESSLIIDMRMSGALEQGSTKVKLKPCIWFFCGSRWCRKIVEKDIKKLNWRLPCDIQIVDEGGPLGFLAASEDSGLDRCRSDASDHAQDFVAIGSFENGEDNSSMGSFKAFSDNSASGSHCPSMTPAQSVAASSHPSLCNTRTDTHKTIHRQGQQTSLYLLPCEFSILTDCNKEFHGDEEPQWIEHIKGHLPDVLPRKLRCWYCFDYTFDADVTSDGSRDFNFNLRMQHIRDHIMFDGSPASWARPDPSIINHLKFHKFVDDETWHRLATQNIVLSGPGIRSSPRVTLPKSSDETNTSLKLSDDMFLDFHVQESYADSSIGLTCRSTIRRHSKIISERFSRMGGVIIITRGSETTLYGVTSGHGLVCQILENTPDSPSESDALPDGSSRNSVYDGDSSSEKSSEDDNSHSHDSSLTAPHANVNRWMNASHGLMATFLNFRADSLELGMVPRETSAMSEKMAGDLALIKIPAGCAEGLRNDFVDPTGPRGKTTREGGRFPAMTKAHGGDNKVFVLLSKTKSVAGSRVAGAVHFSIGGGKIECVRIMVSEELGLGSSGSWVVQNDVLYGMVIAITPMDGCALILPQRRMYSDIQEMFPDANSILLSSGVPGVVFPRFESRKVLAEQVYPESQSRTKRGIWDIKGKEKEQSFPESFQEGSELGRQQGKPSVVEITTNASGTRRKRREQTRYYPSQRAFHEHISTYGHSTDTNIGSLSTSSLDIY